MATTLETKLAASKGRPSGFDYMRISLSVMVVFIHAIITSYGMTADAATYSSAFGGVFRLVLPMFFGLSGFLVAGSLVRTNTLLEFLGLRFLRIYPALTVEVFLSAIVLGAIATTVPLSVYFTSYKFWRYLGNVTGHISYTLPGVFETNPIPNNINQQLWTVPFELECYIAIAAISLLGIKRRPIIAPIAAVLLSLWLFVTKYMEFHGVFPPIRYPTNGVVWIESFLFGASFFLYARRIPWNLPAIVVAGVASVVLLDTVPVAEYFIAPVAVYFTVGLGLMNPKRMKSMLAADYSYGVYLYSFVIQQAMVHFMPFTRNWWINFVIAIPLSFLFAAFSWHVVEKPALRLKNRWPKHLPFLPRMRSPLAVPPPAVVGDLTPPPARQEGSLAG